jgi:hypothetical protein
MSCAEVVRRDAGTKLREGKGMVVRRSHGAGSGMSARHENEAGSAPTTQMPQGEEGVTRNRLI